MVKIIWGDTRLKFQSAAGTTIQQTVVSNKQYFTRISLNHSPMKVLKRNPVTSMITSCIQVSWDYVLQDDDEIEFFTPGGIVELERQASL